MADCSLLKEEKPGACVRKMELVVSFLCFETLDKFMDEFMIEMSSLRIIHFLLKAESHNRYYAFKARNSDARICSRCD